MTEPIPMILHCPECGEQHIDRDNSEEIRITAAERGFDMGSRDWEDFIEENEWTNPPHRTHQCQKCKHEWRPFEYATTGVHVKKISDGYSIFSFWWACVEAEAQLCNEPISDDACVLHFSGCGASAMVTAGHIRSMLAEPAQKPFGYVGCNAAEWMRETGSATIYPTQGDNPNYVPVYAAPQKVTP